MLVLDCVITMETLLDWPGWVISKWLSCLSCSTCDMATLPRGKKEKEGFGDPTNHRYISHKNLQMFLLHGVQIIYTPARLASSYPRVQLLCSFVFTSWLYHEYLGCDIKFGISCTCMYSRVTLHPQKHMHWPQTFGYNIYVGVMDGQMSFISLIYKNAEML